MDLKLRASIKLSTGILAVILNIVEIIFIVKIKRKKRIYEIILASLSVSDCLFSLSNVIFSSILLSKLCKSEENLVEVTYIAYLFFVLASVFHLIFIAVDRVMIVLIPFQYESIFTTKRQKIGITLLWMLAFAISISTYIYYDVTTSENKNSSIRNETNIQNNASASIAPKKNKLFQEEGKLCLRRVLNQSFQSDIQLVLSISIVAADLLIVLCYSTIIYQMSYKSRKYKTAKSKKDEGLPLVCVFIAGVFVIFTLPFAITRFCFSYVHFWWKLFLLFNSGMNSVVYFFRRRLESYQTKIS